MLRVQRGSCCFYDTFVVMVGHALFSMEGGTAMRFYVTDMQ